MTSGALPCVTSWLAVRPPKTRSGSCRTSSAARVTSPVIRSATRSTPSNAALQAGSRLTSSSEAGRAISTGCKGLAPKESVAAGVRIRTGPCGIGARLMSSAAAPDLSMRSAVTNRLRGALEVPHGFEAVVVGGEQGDQRAIDRRDKIA